MDTSLYNNLKQCSALDGDNPTHYTYYGPTQNWRIKDSAWEEFWLNYCENINRFEEEKELKKCCLAEFPTRHLPIIAECTLKFHPMNKTGDEWCPYKFYAMVIYCYQQVLYELLDIDDNHRLTCCLLCVGDSMENNEVVCRFRLQFPYCKTSADIQNKILRPKVIEMLRRENVFSCLQQQPLNDWNDIIDAKTLLQPIIMYGSAKNVGMTPYVLDQIIAKINYEQIENGGWGVFELEDIFKYEDHEHVQQNLVMANCFNPQEHDHEFWLPMFLSVHYNNVVTKCLNPEYENSNLTGSISTSRNSKLSSGETNVPDEQSPEQLAEIFLRMLKTERRENRFDWLDVGQALYSVCGGTVHGLEMWIEFTGETDDFGAEECREQYDAFYSNNYLSLKTLAWYAKEDAPEAYEKWHKQWYKKSLETATNGIHTDVAEAIYRVYWLEFACSDNSKNGLYHFKNHIWTHQPNCIELKRKISGEFRKMYEEYRRDLAEEVLKTSDLNAKNSIEFLIKQISKLVAKLGTTNFKSQVTNECLEKFYTAEFATKLDSNDCLMGCINGIISAGKESAIFRKGKPEDYVSKTTGIIYNENLSWLSPVVKQVVTWLQQVFPTPELYDFVIKLFASCIRGGNDDKIFPIFTGRGDNSKSMLKKQFELSFGAYCITLPTTVFTSKRQGSGPTPELAQAKAAKVAFMDETNSDDTINNGALKGLTGKDKFFARNCNENGGAITASFKLILQCNDVPLIPHPDKAIKNRLCIVPFLSTWTKNPPKTIEEQIKQRLFKMDTTFESKLAGYAPAFLWILVKRYTDYCKEGLVQPQIIKDVTDEYWQQNDMYFQFISEDLEYVYIKDKEINPDAQLTVPQAFTRFKDWIAEFYPGIKINRKNFIEAIDSRLNQKSHGKRWLGLKIRTVIQQGDNVPTF